MDTIAKVDVTERAIAGGWVLPNGWTVNADISPDYSIMDPYQEFDCYTLAQVDAWRRDEWRLVVVSVWVEDASGREWGRDVLGAVEYGTIPITDDTGTVLGHDCCDPLTDNPAEYSAIREHDMIGNALRDAVQCLEEFGTPVFCALEMTFTGL